MSDRAHVGVDGCHFGWISVYATDAGLEFKLFNTMHALVDFHQDASLILVDIPIGLPSASCPARACDSVARKALGPRAASVFSPPCRAATRAINDATARALNINTVGRSLSAQALGISRKIAEVDGLLLSSNVARMKIREIHPEVCFWAFNSQQPMRYPKRKPMGVQERTAILEQEEHGTRALLQRVRQKTLRAQVRDDDVLDALAGYVTARASVSNQLTFFGDGSATDECGLPMEMVYRTTPLAYQVKP